MPGTGAGSVFHSVCGSAVDLAGQREDEKDALCLLPQYHCVGWAGERGSSVRLNAYLGKQQPRECLSTSSS